MENKYYTPTIDEFHVGFEYEFLGTTMTMNMMDMATGDIEQIGKSKPVWEKEIIDLDLFSYRPMSNIQVFITNNQIRVKYLDKDDIESLEWKDDVCPMVDSRIWFPERYHYGISVKHCNFILSYDYDTKHCIISIDNYSTEKWNNQVFNGTINNKSELKRIMKQLNIIQNGTD